jgi:hypothetical protein
MTAMPTEEPDEQEPRGEDVVRAQTFPAEGPLELDVNVGIGRVEIDLGEHEEIQVELRHEPSAQAPWAAGMANVLSWVSERFGDPLGADLRGGSAADAVHEARIEKSSGRLVVRAPKSLPLRNIPLGVTVRAPAGSSVEVRAATADVTVSGTAGRLDLLTGSGDIEADRTEGPATVRTGSGVIRLGTTLAGLQLRTSSGDVEASSLSGSATVVTGTGDVWLGVVTGDVMARSGSGDLSVAEAGSGALELTTGSGDVRVGIRSGVAAELDLTSSGGKVSSELDVSDEPPESDPGLKIRARTGTGDALVTPATR